MKDKNPAAVELGRRGGLIGGRVRAERMTAEQRSDAARHAAIIRWRKTSDNEEAMEFMAEMIAEGLKPEDILSESIEEIRRCDKEIAVIKEDRDTSVFCKEAAELYLTLKKLRKVDNMKPEIGE